MTLPADSPGRPLKARGNTNHREMTTQTQNPAYRPASQTMIMIRVLLFGHFKDALPRGEMTLPLPRGATAADAADALAAHNPRLTGLLDSTRVAVRGEFATGDAPLRDGDEVAFLPPMSGG